VSQVSGVPASGADDDLILNDVQSALNPTRVRRLVRPASVGDVVGVVRSAAVEDAAISVSGSRHSMGGQQFGTDTISVDMRGMDRVLALDADRGIVDVEAGIEWSALLDQLVEMQVGREKQWGIRQKQTGSDHLSIGGALASDIHGRGLTQAPIVGDVESFTVVDANGEVRDVDRLRDGDLFRHVIGGYGLFGIVTSVRLRLAPRQILRRDVSLIRGDELMDAFDDRIAAGYTFGDCQFSIDERSDDFLSLGIFSCYRPDETATEIPAGQRALSVAEWGRLLYLTHVDRAAAAEAYTDHYLSTSGQLYWSDLHQRSEYVMGYHRRLDQVLGASQPGTEIITEIYVPRPQLAAFLRDAVVALRDGDPPLVYGTIRLVERDDEAVLAWAREPWACIIFNLHTVHEKARQEASAEAFQDLIDLAIRHGGSYYLTSHRFARPDQVLACHPRFPEFLAGKRRFDPEERFQSDWYRHYRSLIGAEGPSRPVG
jgi:FAD/FMN-containing dehydrogenase